jgi:hypothetical protein
LLLLEPVSEWKKRKRGKKETEQTAGGESLKVKD